MFGNLLKSRKFVIAFLLVLTVIGLPATILMVNQQQDIRQEAARSTSACSTIQQQLDYLENNNLCGASLCDSLRDYMQQLNCSGEPTPTSFSATPTAYLCSISNPRCPAGYECNTITGTQGVCIPTTSILTPTPGGCQQEPSHCGSWWAQWDPRCIEPSSGWCAISQSPTPSTNPSPSSTITTAPPVCGDGICQSITCTAIGCPTPETAESCPQDCANTTASPTTIPPISQPQATNSPTPIPTSNPNVNSPAKARFDFDDNGIIDLPDLNILLTSFEERFGD